MPPGAAIVALVDIDPPHCDRRATAELPRVLYRHSLPDTLHLEIVELLLARCLDQGRRKMLLREVVEERPFSTVELQELDMSSLHDFLASTQAQAPVEVVATAVVVVVREVQLGVTVVLLHADVPVEEDPILLELDPQPPKHGSAELQGEDGWHPRNATVA